MKSIHQQKPSHILSHDEYHNYQIITALFVILASFVVGLIPITLAFGLNSSNVDNNVNMTTQTSPWSVMGEDL